MNYPKIIGVTGRKFNGKDTIADYLCQNCGYVRIAYADPLKEVCRILFGFDDDQLYGKRKEEIDARWNVTPRVLFQYIGTDIFRRQIGSVIPNLDDKFWVKCLNETIKMKLNNNPDLKFVVSDIRFQNEIDSLKNEFENVKIIRVNRPSININLSNEHESEMIENLNNIDYEVINDSDVINLYSKIETLFN